MLLRRRTFAGRTEGKECQAISPFVLFIRNSALPCNGEATRPPVAVCGLEL
jgi:hypothetical protein